MDQASSFVAALPDVKALYVHSLPAAFLPGGSSAMMMDSSQEASLIYAYPPPMMMTGGDDDAARHLTKYLAFADQHAKISQFDNSTRGDNELCERLVYRHANGAAWIVHQVIAERRWLATWVLGGDAVWSAYAHLSTSNHAFLLAIQQVSMSS